MHKDNHQTKHIQTVIGNYATVIVEKQSPKNSDFIINQRDDCHEKL